MLINIPTRSYWFIMKPLAANENNSRRNPNAPTTVKFKYLIKDVNLKNMKIEFEKHRNRKLKKVFDGNVFHFLDMNFAQSLIKRKKIPERPFLLIPLFKILDYDGEEVEHKFFKNNKFRQIGVLKKNGGSYLACNSKLYVYKRGLLYRRDTKTDFDLSNPIFSPSNGYGYFILKDHNSDSAMMYVGVFSETFLPTQIEELYDHYILKKESPDEKIREGDINMECQWDINDLQKNMSLLVIFKRKISACKLQPAFPTEITESTNSKLTIKLNGKKTQNGDLNFEISQYFNGKQVNNLFFRLQFCYYPAQVYYEAFKQKLKKQNTKR